MNKMDKNKSMIAALNVVADMVGERKTVDGNEVGLNMTAQATRCREEAQMVADGLFRVVVMGTFTSGKSTLINALLGSKVLPESVLPSTAVLTFVQYGENTDEVEIHFKDTVNEDGSVTPGITEIISQEEFLNRYQYNNEDNREFNETGSVSRFKDVAYSVVRCSLPMTQDGVNFVDSPGLEDKTTATELALDIAKKAQAIIYICGERGFAEADREYFSDNFMGNQGNVFFILNKVDRIESEIQLAQAMEKLHNDVRICFMNVDGHVDEDMMEKRVFCLSALDALDARRGMIFDKDLQKDVPLDEDKKTLKLERSNFTAFEDALVEFLSTDARCTAQYKKVFDIMVGTYHEALEKVRTNLSFYETQHGMNSEQKRECERIIREIELSLAATDAAFNSCALKLKSTMSLLIQHAVDSVDHTWEIDLPELHEKIRFGMKQYLSLAISNINVFKSKEEREQNMRRILMPFSEIVADHISGKIDSFMASNRPVLENTIREAEAEVNANLTRISSLFDSLGNVLTDTPDVAKPGDQDWLQALISYCIGDASMIVKNCAGGKTAWMEFVRKAVFNALWQWTIIQIMTGGWGIVVCALIEWLQINNGKNEMIDRMLTESKNAALKEIRRKLDDRLNDMGANIAIKINEIKEAQCGSTRQQLEDERARLAELENNIIDITFSAIAERTRCQHIIDTMAQEIAKCYEDVFETTYTEILPKL